ncbi:hypothetical protein [Legionella sp. W05-934-2]|jgi:tetratricopeptide (TPR) repeat protein|uniref:tetratricopeptide repeat protein n=1 Tax=Legionella sp. W05-934-2 TaxID=1198649 RepID=UPI0034626DD6
MRVLLIVFSCFVSFQLGAKPLAPVFDGLGQAYFKADTQNKEAQTYFNQGMVLFYGFDYGESTRSFQASTKADPNCVRCYIGLALSMGSATNLFLKGDEPQKALKILEKADSLKPKNPIDLGLIQALKRRYQLSQTPSHASNGHHCAFLEVSLPAENNLAFANALHNLSLQHPDNTTIQTLFAYSVFAVENWDFYDNLLDIKPYALMMKQSLEKVLAIEPNHPGAIHYYIHLMEWSRHPEQAVKFANKLPELTPMAEHLVHMPTHIMIRMGEYQQAVDLNQKAVAVSDKYESLCRKQGFKPEVNLLNQHNLDYLLYSATLNANGDIAYQAALKLKNITPFNWLMKVPSLQRFHAELMLVIAHFGMWDALTSIPEPGIQYPYLKAIWSYAQALHAMQINDKASAKRYIRLFHQAAQANNQDTDTKDAFENNLKIAKNILLAHQADMNGNADKSIYFWHQAVATEKAGGDPPSWLFPASQGLGFAFLSAGKYQQAIATFQSDLKIHPHNIWSLTGIKQAYQAMGDKQNVASYQRKIEELKAGTLPKHSDVLSSTMR